MSNRTQQLWRWPMWSWRNLVVTVAAVLLLFTALGRITGSPSDPGVTHTGASATSTTMAVPPSSDPAVTTEPEPSPRVTPTAVAPSAAPKVNRASATSVAEGFAMAWCRSGLPPKAWLDGIRPLASGPLAKALSQTDPARVPATKVTGEAELVTASASAARVTVPTDGGTIVLSLAKAGERWTVGDVAPADQPPGAPTPSLTPSGRVG